MKKLAGIAAAATTALFLGMAAATPASAALPLCSVDDITPSADACSGYYDKNTFNDEDITEAALAALGLDWDGTFLESIDVFDPDGVVDFTADLNGVTYLAIHWGGGQGPVPGNPGGVTGYYRLDLADDAQLDFFTTNFQSNSGARLFKTSDCRGDCDGGGNEIPEPSTWALMIMGFGSAGYMLRRRRAVVA